MHASILRKILPALAFVSLVVAGSAARAQTPPPNYSDIWWNPAESGWGLTIADHETQLFAVWYTYAKDGRPTWLVIPGGTFSADKLTFSGDVFRTTGPAYNAATFDSSQVKSTKVGTAALDFTPILGAPAGAARFTYTVDGVSGSKVIQRQPFGGGAANWGSDYTDIWWNPDESGWGMTLAQHGDNVFGVWYTYDTDGQPIFAVVPGVTMSDADHFSGDVYTTTGPWFGNAAFDPAAVKATKAGAIAFSMVTRKPTPAALEAHSSGAWTGTFRNAAQSRNLQRQPFGLATRSGSCVGTFQGTITNCGTLSTFDSTIEVADISDWAFAVPQQAVVTLRPGFFSCRPSIPVIVLGGSDEDVPAPITIRRGGQGQILGHGTWSGSPPVGFGTNSLTIDFHIDDGIHMSGTLSRNYSSSATFDTWQWQAPFTCTLPH